MEPAQALWTSNRTATASSTAWSRVARRGSGTGSHGSWTRARPAGGRRAPRRPRRGRRPSRPADRAARPGSARRGRPRPRTPDVPGCRGAARTAAGSARRPWCAPARAAARSCARPGRPRGAAPRRSRPCARAARPTPPAGSPPPRRPRRPAARRTTCRTGGGPRTSSRRRPPRSAPRPPTANPVSPCRPRKLVTQRSTRSPGTSTMRPPYRDADPSLMSDGSAWIVEGRSTQDGLVAADHAVGVALRLISLQPPSPRVVAGRVGRPSPTKLGIRWPLARCPTRAVDGGEPVRDRLGQLGHRRDAEREQLERLGDRSYGAARPGSRRRTRRRGRGSARS